MTHPGATSTDKHKVVIIGSGFGGLKAAKSLKRADVDIKMIAKTTHHLFQPLLYQVATGIISEGEIAPLTRVVLRNNKNCQVVLGEVTDIDLTNQTVDSILLGHTYRTPYDTLIVAAGAGQSYFGNDHFAEWAPGMKTIDDALELRGRIMGAFEAAERRQLMAVLMGLGVEHAVGFGDDVDPRRAEAANRAEFCACAEGFVEHRLVGFQHRQGREPALHRCERRSECRAGEQNAVNAGSDRIVAEGLEAFGHGGRKYAVALAIHRQRIIEQVHQGGLERHQHRAEHDEQQHEGDRDHRRDEPWEAGAHVGALVSHERHGAAHHDLGGAAGDVEIEVVEREGVVLQGAVEGEAVDGEAVEAEFGFGLGGDGDGFGLLFGKIFLLGYHGTFSSFLFS